jgi:ribosomal protein S18 acetylase RimI-like enzyme
MIHLKEINEANLEQCEQLERKSNRYVGNSFHVLAEAYVHRDCATAYGICNDDIMVGMLVLLDRPNLKNYSFTDLFIADNHQRCGYATKAVKYLVDKFKDERKYSEISLCVHNSNTIAIKIYENEGFTITEKASWDENFFMMILSITI